MKCPLCNGDSLIEQDIDVSLLINLWANHGVNVSKLFELDRIFRCICENCGLGFYSPPSPGDDAFYGRLAEWDWYYKHEGKSEYNFASNLIPPNSKIIDIGCGIGELSTYLDKSVNFSGVELSPKSVEIAKSLNRNVEQLNICKAPENYKNAHDFVTCFQVLEHIVDIHVFFEALISLCKNNGTIIIAVPNNDGFVGSAVNNIFNLPPHHSLLWGRKSLHYLAAMYNLDVVDYIEEPLAKIHKNWAYSVKIGAYIYKLFTSKPLSPANATLRWKLINKISILLARLIEHVNPGLLFTGHSSIIVLRKKYE